MIIFRSNAIITDANIVDKFVEEEKSHRPALARMLGEGSFVRDYLNLSERMFARFVTESTLQNGRKRIQFVGRDLNLYAISTKDGLVIRREGTTALKPVEMSRERCCEMLSGKKVKASMLDRKVFQKLCDELLRARKDGREYPDAEKRPLWLDLISVDDDVVAGVIDEVKHILFSPVKDIIDGLGMTKTDFAKELMVSYRTVENWCTRATGLKYSTRILIAQHFWFYGTDVKKGNTYVIST